MSKFHPVTATRSTFGTKAASLGVGALTTPVKSAVLLTAGDVTVKTVSGPNIPFVGLPAGYVIPFVITEVVALANGATLMSIDDA